MKKIIFFLFLSIPILMEGKTNFLKFVEEHDVPLSIKTMDRKDPLYFWGALSGTSEQEKFVKNISSGKGTGEKALDNFVKLEKINPLTDPSVLDSCEIITDDLMDKVGNLSSITIGIIDDDSYNAFSTFTNDLNPFIGINAGVLMDRETTQEMIIGILAHEYAHAVLLHMLKSEYSKAKREKRNKIMGGIAAGLNSVAAGADAYSSAVFGTQPQTDKYIQRIEELPQIAAKDLTKFKYKYGRELELEADLIAYRFMEWAGYGGENYIAVLKKINSLEAAIEFPSNSLESDHPSTQERIEFIQYVREHPYIGRIEKK